LAIGVPFVLLALPTAWWVVTHVALPLPHRVANPLERPPHQPWSRSERIVAAAMASCLGLWLTRSPLNLGDVRWAGWGHLFPSRVDDGYVAIAIALVLFMFPGDKVRPLERYAVAGTHGDDASEDAFLLSWRRAARAVPWSVLSAATIKMIKGKLGPDFPEALRPLNGKTVKLQIVRSYQNPFHRI
jgi:hypothetical protein